MASAGSSTPTEYAGSEMPVSEAGEATPAPGNTFPPYPPYAVEPAPPSVADTIMAGRDMRVKHKSTPKKPVRPAPKPAKPRGPKATDVKLSKRATRAHARCLRRHNAVLPDRLEKISKPARRNIICLWRENADTLPADTIARLRSMLDADEPFKPEQAYEYFINLKKSKKKTAAKSRVNQIQKDVLSMCVDKRFIWARNATVAFARGIQQRLSRPGSYALADTMLRLSNIILSDICGFMNTKPPSRRCQHPKAKFMMEMSDKVAVWIDEILCESDDKMLMMDFDEDEDVLSAMEFGDTGFADDFLNMMGGGGLLKGPQSAYLKFSGEMLEAFTILTSAMTKKGSEELLRHGKFVQTYADAADELKSTSDFKATEFNTTLAAQLKKDLAKTAKPDTPAKIEPQMKNMVEICSNYLAQHAEANKEKGPAFRQLIKAMKKKPNDELFRKGKAHRTLGTAATELEKSNNLENDHDDPNLSQQIHGKLAKLVENETTPDMKTDMKETVDVCSKYLSQNAVDENERGPAFDLLIKELEKSGGEPFTPEYPAIGNKFAAAYALKSAPGLESIVPDPSTAPKFVPLLHRVVDTVTPKRMANEMNEVIQRCANYLSAFVRDRDKALQGVIQMMKANPNKELVKRNTYAMNYATAAAETIAAPSLVPYLPVKDISDEAKTKLTADMENSTPDELKIATKSVVQDVAKHLSQPVALRSGAAGEGYGLSYLTAIMDALGKRPLFKFKSYGQTYADAAEVLKYAGPLESDPKGENLAHEISAEMARGVDSKTAPTIAAGLSDAVTEASRHLAKEGLDKGNALDKLVTMMKAKGDEPLGHMQGYQQSYKDAARRIENTPSLANDKVDKGAYEAVRGKLTTLAASSPTKEYEQQMPSIIEESSKFLATPAPETEADKRQILSDLMSRKGSEVLGGEGLYKMTYSEAGEEIIKAPVGVITAHDAAKVKDNLGKVNTAIPDKKLQDMLKDPANEGAAYITDLIKGRGEAMQVIHDAMKKEGNNDFLNVGKFQKTHDQAARMLETADHFGGHHPSPVLLDMATNRVDQLPKTGGSEMAKQYMDETAAITAAYIAGVATEESGLDAKALAAMDPVGGGMASGLATSAGSGFGSGSGSGVGGGVGSRAGGGRGSASGSGMGSGAGGMGGGAGGIGGGPGGKGGGVDGMGGDAGGKGGGAGGMGGEAGGLAGGGRGGVGSEDEEELRRKGLTGERGAAGRRGGGRRGGGAGSDDDDDDETTQRGRGGSGRLSFDSEFDPEHREARKILLKQLRSKGNEVLYKQPQTELTHSQSADWLSKTPPRKLDKTVKESPDTARLSNKFERKLSTLVSKATPSDMYDTMQDVVIESSRNLAEQFVSSNYKALVKDALISEMQKRGNEILIEVDGAAETYFFAAQRLKKAKSLDVEEPCNQVSYYLSKNLDEMIRCRSMARKLFATMKEHTKNAADYLSELVTKPDEKIEAYVALLGEMETTGDALLIEGDIPKSYKDAAAYLRQLTSFEDQIRRGNGSLQSSTESKLRSIMADVPPRGYTKSNLDSAISMSTKLLVSYIMLQGEKTEALKELIDRLEEAGDGVLLRHGTIRKSYTDGAELLRGKNADQLAVINTDPVVSRKIQIKLVNLMQGRTPDKYYDLMDDVIEDTTMYLAVHFLQPRVIQVCQCMKNVFVQCELWCDEILRRVARPCCTCSRHVSAQALSELAPAQRIRISPGTSTAFAPGLEISLNQCPSRQSRAKTSSAPCSAAKPSPGCTSHSATTQYLLYSTSYNQRKQGCTSFYSHSDSLQTQETPDALPISQTPYASPIRSLLSDMHGENAQLLHRRREGVDEKSDSFMPSFHTPLSTSSAVEGRPPYWQAPTTMYAKMLTQDIKLQTRPPRTSTTNSGFSTRTPIISTDQMSDWHAMMVSLMWNVQAWRDWIQDNIDKALNYELEPSVSAEKSEQNWTDFQRRVATEALQWRQYNIFSRQLTLRLVARYKDKQIVSPTRATNKTKKYMECQQEMLDIIEMFNRWTQWLTAVVKETNSLVQSAGVPESIHELRWNHFKNKVLEYSDDWTKYNTHLKVCWENKYRTLISDWLPAWKQPGPVWVVSACGAVPSGAVAAGVFDNELVWLARTTHSRNVLPAALHPSKHCCVVYADGSVHHYTKYQVMCNADAKWVAWRAGTVGARAVRVAPGTHVGRVHYRGSHLVGAVHAPHYRCHVVIYGRPFAFNCYELLVLGGDEA